MINGNELFTFNIVPPSVNIFSTPQRKNHKKNSGNQIDHVMIPKVNGCENQKRSVENEKPF